MMHLQLIINYLCKRRVSFNMWSAEDDEKLVDFVRTREELFNIKNNKFRLHQHKMKLWGEIGKPLNKTGMYVLSIIINIVIKSK